jgi:hypothetical protein
MVEGRFNQLAGNGECRTCFYQTLYEENKEQAKKAPKFIGNFDYTEIQLSFNILFKFNSLNFGRLALPIWDAK